MQSRYRGPYMNTRVLGNDRYLVEDIPEIQLTSRRCCSVYSADKIKRCDGSPELGYQDNAEADYDFQSNLAELSTLK